MANGDVLQIVAGHQAFADPPSAEGLSADIVAGLEGAASPSASNPFATASGLVRLRKFTLTNAQMLPDIVEGVLISTIYTLQPGDWVMLAQVIISEGFDDSGAPQFEVDTWNGASQHALNVAIGPSASEGSDGRLGGDIGITTWGALGNVNPITPLTAALEIQVRAGMNGDGLTGSLTVLLWVAEF